MLSDFCRRFAGVLLLVGAFAGGADARMITHFDVDAVPALPQVTLDAIGQQTWFFTHASLGQNCVLHKGTTRLHQAEPDRYQLVAVQVEPAFGAAPDPPPIPTVPGTIYHWPRGQCDWRGKFAKLDHAVRTQGWRSPAVQIVVDKLCFIDFEADASTYLATMAALEQDFPDTIFVYATLPLLRSDVPEHPEWRDHCVLTNQYNDAVRAHCVATGKLLYDIADIEAHDPDGQAWTYEHGGGTYQALYPGYAAQSSNYLNDLGSQRVGLAWYAAAAVLANDPTGDLNCDGRVDFGDINPFVLALTDRNAYTAQYPACTWRHADCNDDEQVNFADINVFVNLLTR